MTLDRFASEDHAIDKSALIESAVAYYALFQCTLSKASFRESVRNALESSVKDTLFIMDNGIAFGVRPRWYLLRLSGSHDVSGMSICGFSMKVESCLSAERIKKKNCSNLYEVIIAVVIWTVSATDFNHNKGKVRHE